MAFNNLSFSSLFISVQFLDLKKQVKQSCAAGGDITLPKLCFTPFVFTGVKNCSFYAWLGVPADFMLCTEVGEREASSQGLYRIPQKFWFLASHGSSIKHSCPPWAKWNAPETPDWSHSCLIFMDICSVGRFTPLTQSIIQGVCSSYYNQHHILAPNSPIPKSSLHLKHFPLIGI